MVRESLKSALHQKTNRLFLKKLYSIDNTENVKRKKIINKAKNSNISVLLQVLRAIFVGEIPIRKTLMGRVIQSKKLPFLQKHFEDEEGYKRLQSNSIKEQKEVLIKINTFHQLLFNLFNLK
jgi:hypothetical protein